MSESLVKLRELAEYAKAQQVTLWVDANERVVGVDPRTVLELIAVAEAAQSVAHDGQLPPAERLQRLFDAVARLEEVRDGS